MEDIIDQKTELELQGNIVTEDKNLEKLQEINEDITKIEKKLEEVPGAAPLDMTKYNRKQRRHMERAMKHNEKEKQKELIQKGNTFVTRREFVGLFQSMQKLRDRMYYIDVLTAAMEKLLIEKNILTEDELKNTIKSETEKALAFQDIQKGQKDYENRIKKCIELGIDPNISIISQQIYEDAEMPLAEKKELAKTYNLEVLLKIFSDEETEKTT
jgi:hypothetical protein